MSDAPKRAKFIMAGTTPPVGWVYEIVHEDVKYRFQSPMRHGLFLQLRQWYSAKGLEWPGDAEMTARVEHHICQLCPPGFCEGGPNRPAVPYLSVAMIRDGTKLLLRRIFARKEFLVDQDEANRRARICANCSANLHGICTSCPGNEFFEVFGWFIRAGRKTPYDQALDTCAICKCLLRAKIWVRQETLNDLSKHEYLPNCWLFGTPAHVPEKKTES